MTMTYTDRPHEDAEAEQAYVPVYARGRVKRANKSDKGKLLLVAAPVALVAAGIGAFMLMNSGETPTVGEAAPAAQTAPVLPPASLETQPMTADPMAPMTADPAAMAPAAPVQSAPPAADPAPAAAPVERAALRAASTPRAAQPAPAPVVAEVVEPTGPQTYASVVAQETAANPTAGLNAAPQATPTTAPSQTAAPPAPAIVTRPLGD